MTTNKQVQITMSLRVPKTITFTISVPSTDDAEFDLAHCEILAGIEHIREFTASDVWDFMTYGDQLEFEGLVKAAIGATE
jgi:hypothetical protein